MVSSKKKKKLCNGYMEIHVVGYMKQYVYSQPCISQTRIRRIIA